jgi:hypothetical protein
MPEQPFYCADEEAGREGNLLSTSRISKTSRQYKMAPSCKSTENRQLAGLCHLSLDVHVQ